MKQDGQRCKANAKNGVIYCRWHSQTQQDQQLHQESSRRGGFARAASLFGPTAETAPLDTDDAVATLDLTTAHGVRGVLAATLRALTQLPLSTKVAAVIAQLAQTQKGVILDSDLEERIRELEAIEVKKASA